MSTTLKKIIFIISICFTIILIFTTMPTTVSAASITAISTKNQTVRLGPSSKNYATAGSISANESIIILGKVKNLSWYHIKYTITGKKTTKTGYIPTNSVRNIKGGIPGDEIYNGGQRVATETQTVYTSDNVSNKLKLGTIYKNEGFTELYGYTHYSGTYISYIEYSTSDGTKRGYLYKPKFKNSLGITVSSVARVKKNISPFYGESEEYYATAGSIDAGEYVTVIAKLGDWVYVEYNTKSGRKRAYTSAGNLDFHVKGLYYRDLFGTKNGSAPYNLSANKTVYAGPSNQYATVTSINKSQTYYILYETSTWCFIKFKRNNKYLSGWVYQL